MILTYEALDAQGHRTSDTVDAMSEQEAREQLRRRGLYVTRLKQPAARGGRSLAHRERGEFAALPLKTLVLFTRQMAMLARAGSGVVPAITAVRRQMRKPAQGALLDDIIAHLEDGASLAEALRRHPQTFDPVYCAIVAAGEASAKLTEMFDRLASIVGKRRAMRNRVAGALAYPALLTVMSTGILLVLLFFVLPRFDAMFRQLHVQTPALTRFMLGTAHVLTTYWPVVVLGTALCAAGGFFLVTSDRGKQWISDIQLCIPLLGRLRARLIQMQIFRTMGTLVQSGVGVLDTLELARGSTRNGRFQRLFDEMHEAVTSGGQLSAAFENSGVMDPSVCQAVRTGEDSGNLGEALTYCADVLDEINTELINTLVRLVEPAILIGMGLFIGCVAVSLFLPLFDMTSALR